MPLKGVKDGKGAKKSKKEKLVNKTLFSISDVDHSQLVTVSQAYLVI